jgi:outer membrane autotransporter protein
VVMVGGDGGGRGDGGAVTVTNGAGITTHGALSHAIMAESIGGGGGSARTTSGVLAIGGSGGVAGAGGLVTVTNSGAVTTNGVSSNGIMAMSVGGGGGSGAAANGLMSFGGSGGSTGDGGNVTVTNAATGSITTSGDMAYAIYAQSVGGGGGGGGNVVAATLAAPSIALGGSGGAAGNGGTVVVDNLGAITTHGAVALGIFAQSVGGGGGNGGSTGSYSANSPGAFAVGGDGGSSGNGGNVTVTNGVNASITTTGVGSTAIFAQSVGGGGGNGGGAMAVSAGTMISFSLGGTGASGGNGGNVSVTNNGAITTSGVNSVAIFAQSVGGGGGTAGSSLSAAIGAVVPIGGTAGVVGTGGDVTVINNGSIHMTGAGSVALFAQSIGGGGGVATADGAATFALNAGGNGNGGTVTVQNNGTIVMDGDNAAGVFVQSVGGGGGIIGKSGDLLGLDPMFQGTAGGVGLAANVAITQDHDVTTTGLNSVALLAQSAGGTGNGNIDVTVTAGTTITGGSGTGAGVGFLDGAINLLTNRGTITSVRQIGGFAVTGTGGNETIDNFGTMIGSVNLGAGANALSNKSSGLFNMGTSVYLGTGNLFTNDGTMSPGGIANVFTSGVTGNLAQSSTGVYALDLDFAANTADRINVSGTGSMAGKVAINILNRSQVLPGSHQLTIVSTGGGATDAGLTLDVRSSAIVTYALQYPNPDDVVLAYDISFKPTALPPQFASIGNAINAIQTARNSPGFAPIASALFDLPDVKALSTFYTAVGGGGTATTQQAAFGAGTAFTSLMFDQMTSWIAGNASTDGVVFDDNTAQAYAAMSPADVTAKSAFGQIRGAGVAGFSDRWRAWAAPFGSRQSIDSNTSLGTPGSVVATAGGGLGVERQLGNDAVFGFSAGGSGSSYVVADRSTSGRLEGGHAGFYGAVRHGALYVSGSAGYGRFDNQMTRQISAAGLPGELASGRFASDQFAGRLELGWRQAFDRIAVTPFAAIQVASIWQRGYTESTLAGGTPGILGLSYQPQQTTSLPSSLGVQLDSKLSLLNGQVWSPYLRAAWVHEFRPDRNITAAFNVAPGFLFSTVGTSAVADSAHIVIGSDLALSNKVSVFSTFATQVGAQSLTYAGSGGVRFAW